MPSVNAYVPWVSSDPELRDEDVVPHPTKICEPINLATTDSPTLSYTPQTTSKHLSTMQSETIRIIMASLLKRGSFLLGDATGVGKGRTIAGLILEYTGYAFDEESRVLWVSANCRLETDARRELETVGVNKSFVTFSSYANLLHNKNFQSVQEWLTVEKGGLPLIILDECHLLRNEKCACFQVVNELLNSQVARVVYSSATPCSQTRHLAYLGRLGLFDSVESPFESYSVMQSELSAHGSSYMELLAMDMKSRGAYVARQLSFDGVGIESHVHCLTIEERMIYTINYTDQ